jgi:hypothetical protein
VRYRQAGTNLLRLEGQKQAGGSRQFLEHPENKGRAQGVGVEAAVRDRSAVRGLTVPGGAPLRATSARRTKPRPWRSTAPRKFSGAGPASIPTRSLLAGSRSMRSGPTASSHCPASPPPRGRRVGSSGVPVRAPRPQARQARTRSARRRYGGRKPGTAR